MSEIEIGLIEVKVGETILKLTIAEIVDLHNELEKIIGRTTVVTIPSITVRPYADPSPYQPSWDYKTTCQS